MLVPMNSEHGIQVEVDAILDSFEHGERWVKGEWSDERGNCLHQGVRMCQPVLGDAYLIEQVADRQGWGVDWNDDEDRTFDDVKQKLVQHREILPHELEETFGPQWAHIMALVRRASVATEVELGIMWGVYCSVTTSADGELNWIDNWSKSFVRARTVATYADRNNARIAAQEAAWRASPSHVRAVAIAAAVALSTRDLIGNDGYKQADYDLLTKPWREVIGKVHPDDT